MTAERMQITANIKHYQNQVNETERAYEAAQDELVVRDSRGFIAAVFRRHHSRDSRFGLRDDFLRRRIGVE